MARWLPIGLAVLCLSSPAFAQDPDADRVLNLAEPDFTLGALPTTLRLPARTFGFRITHRFSRPIASGSVGDFFADFFGMDGAARIGFEVRYGLCPGTQLVAHRTNDRAIQLMAQQSVLAQSDTRPFAVGGYLAVEGGNNFREDFSGTIGVVLSRAFKDRAAIYAQPILVFNSNPDSLSFGSADDHTLLIGLGARLRIAQSNVYLIAEAAPQVAGFRDGVDHVSFGIERRAGGHSFQLTISNALGTTFRQIARGGATQGDWHIGFNLTRKFF